MKEATTLLEIMTNDQESSAKIIVVGVGGAGNNAVNRMNFPKPPIMSVHHGFRLYYMNDI